MNEVEATQKLAAQMGLPLDEARMLVLKHADAWCALSGADSSMPTDATSSRSAAQLAEQAEELIGSGEALLACGDTQAAMEAFTQCWACVEPCRDLMQKMPFTGRWDTRVKVLFVLNSLGWAYDGLGQHKEAIDHFELALAIACELPSSREFLRTKAIFHKILSDMFKDLRQYDKALKLSMHNLALICEAGD